MAYAEASTTRPELTQEGVIELINERTAKEPEALTSAGFFDYVERNDFAWLAAQLIKMHGKPEQPFDVIYQNSGSSSGYRLEASINTRPLTKEQRELPPNVAVEPAPSIIHLHALEDGEPVYGISLPVDENYSIDRTRKATVARRTGRGKRSESFTLDIGAEDEGPSFEARSAANTVRHAMQELALAAAQIAPHIENDRLAELAQLDKIKKAGEWQIAFALLSRVHSVSRMRDSQELPTSSSN